MSRTFWRLCELLAQQHQNQYGDFQHEQQRDHERHQLQSDDCFDETLVMQDWARRCEDISNSGCSDTTEAESSSDLQRSQHLQQPQPSSSSSSFPLSPSSQQGALSVASSGSRDFDIQTLKSSISNLSQDMTPMRFDDPSVSMVNFKPAESLRITCLTIGSRGDVQPYIALCKGLIVEGHKPRIATHQEFEPWVRQHGIDFAPIDGDPAELMALCVENGMFTYSFLREASTRFRGWIDGLFSSSWKSCQGSDILIESPSAMAGIHIAEALNIPYFRAFTMPWTRTSAYPHAFAAPENKMGGAFNYMTYVMFDNLFWKAISGQVNRWRAKELGLRSTSLDKMQPTKVPFLYNYSPSVVPPPLDYSHWIRVTGYWFLDEGAAWTPPDDLLDFIRRAKEDKKKIVYIGFGSIVVSDPLALTRTVVKSVLNTDVRCILSKGWSDRLNDPSSTKAEIPLPPEIFPIKSAPHDWLFSQVDAVAHHGGAGTTGASLRAGVPTIVKPFFGDQFFFGSRVKDLGVGIYMTKLNSNAFSRALWEVTNNERLIIKAKLIGEKIRKEDGVSDAIQVIYRDLEYAKTLTQIRRNASASASTVPPEDPNDNEDYLDGIEETWTFVGDDLFQSTTHDKEGAESFFVRGEGAVAGTIPPKNNDEEDVAC